MIDAAALAVGIPAVIFAGISKGGFGSGAAFAAGAILALVLPPAEALGLMLPLLLVIDAALVRPYWRRWSWPEARLLIAGAAPGVALGVWLLDRADPDILRVLIGAIALAFVAWSLAAPRVALGGGRAMGLVAGLGAGFTSFVSHAGGPILA
ncbi:MAG: TSUP family transporter, partial [Shimia sp.]